MNDKEILDQELINNKAGQKEQTEVIKGADDNNTLKFIPNTLSSSDLDINNLPIIRNLDTPFHLSRAQIKVISDQQILMQENTGNGSTFNSPVREKQLQTDKGTQKERDNYQTSAMNANISEKISKVKRYVDDDKMSQLEFIPDIIRSQLVLVEADLLMLKQNYYKAAEVLTKDLESSLFYTSHLRFEIIEKLSYIFERGKIKSVTLQELHSSFNEKMSQRIAFVSGCKQLCNQKRTYLFCKDLLEILGNDNDKFGLIVNNAHLPFSLQIPLMKLTQITSISQQIKLHSKQIYREIFKLQNSTQKCFRQRRSCRKGSNLISLRQQNLLKKQNKKFFTCNFFQKKDKKLTTQLTNLSGKSSRSTQEGGGRGFQKQFFQRDSQSFQIKEQLINESQDINFLCDYDQDHQQQFQSTILYSQNINNTFYPKQSSTNFQNPNANNYVGNLLQMQIKPTQFNTNNSNLIQMPHYFNSILNTPTLQQQNTPIIDSSQQFNLLPIIGQSLFQTTLEKQSIPQSLQQNPHLELKNYQPQQEQLQPVYSIFQPQQFISQAVQQIDQAQQQMYQTEVQTFNQLQESQSKLKSNQQNQVNDLKLEIQLLKEIQKPQKQNKMIKLEQMFREQELQKSIEESQFDVQMGNASQIKIFKDKNLIRQKNKQTSTRKRNEIQLKEFHICIRKAIIEILFDGRIEEKVFITSKKDIVKEQNDVLYNNSNGVCEQKFIIYATDQPKFAKDQRYTALIQFLYKYNIILIILTLNEKEQQRERHFPMDECVDNREVIIYFYSEERLLQYIYNRRGKPLCNSQPLIYEHFQTIFIFIIFSI